MRLTRPLVVWGLAWLAAVFGLLRLGNLPGDLGHALCGPWG
jgi:hypothetical protein